MRHSWILEVLNDLRSYADKNDLTAIAAAAAQALDVAEKELHSLGQGDDDLADGPAPD